jgi:predicted dehydrogenase
MADRLKLALVGAGAIAQAYAKVLERSSCAALAAVADVRPEAATALAEAYGCDRHAGHRELIEAGKVEGAVVCTPPASHPDICVDLVEAGLPVLCEKPLAIEREAAVRMIEVAERRQTILTMASKFRYASDVVRAKSIVESGILGDIVLFENAFTSRVDMARRWNSRPEISGGGVLIDNGTHSVDIMRYFLGPLESVHAVEGRRSQGLAVEETVRIFVRSRSGVLGNIDLSWSINKELDSYINIYGSRGTVSVGWRRSRYRQASSADWVDFGEGYDKLQALSDQVTNFVRAVRGEERLCITAEDALASVEVIEAAYADLGRAHWIQVDPSTSLERVGAGSEGGAA